jgi:hypothetical protein
MRERVAPVLAARQQHIFEFQTAKTPNRAVIARSEATKQSILSLCCAMDCFASLAMTSFYQTRLRIPATRSARIMPESSAPKRAWGMPGARCTRGLVRKGKWGCTHEHTGSAEAPGIPARDGFNGFLRALPGDRALLPPSFADRSTTLTPASGRRGVRTTRLRRPLSRRSSKALPASTASRSNVRDDRETPLCGTGCADYDLIWSQARRNLFLRLYLDTPNHVDPSR